MHRALLLVLFGLGGILALGAAVAIMVRGRDVWLLPVAVLTIAGAGWLVASVRRRG